MENHPLLAGERGSRLFAHFRWRGTCKNGCDRSRSIRNGIILMWFLLFSFFTEDIVHACSQNARWIRQIGAATTRAENYALGIGTSPYRGPWNNKCLLFQQSHAQEGAFLSPARALTSLLLFFELARRGLFLVFFRECSVWQNGTTILVDKRLILMDINTMNWWYFSSIPATWTEAEYSLWIERGDWFSKIPWWNLYFDGNMRDKKYEG